MSNITERKRNIIILMCLWKFLKVFFFLLWIYISWRYITDKRNESDALYSGDLNSTIIFRSSVINLMNESVPLRGHKFRKVTTLYKITHYNCCKQRECQRCQWNLQTIIVYSRSSVNLLCFCRQVLCLCWSLERMHV